MYDEAIDERAIKIAASLTERLTLQGIPLEIVTNETRLKEGKGTQHMRNIFETLAHINTSAPPPKPFAKILDGITAESRLEPEYWLISSYYSKNLDEAFTHLQASGARTVWIMPEPCPHDADYAERVIFV